jgi:hypothetical protein
LVQHWDSELGGKDMFHDHVLSHFAEELKTGELSIKEQENEAARDALTDAINDAMATLSMGAGDFNFAEGRVVFGYGQR